MLLHTKIKLFVMVLILSCVLLKYCSVIDNTNCVLVLIENSKRTALNCALQQKKKTVIVKQA